MAYNNGTSGYNRRRGIINGGGPSAPAAGYSAWFDAGQNVFSDTGGTVAAVNAGPLRSWNSRGGSAGTSQLHVQAIGTGLTYRTAVINGQPAIAGDGATSLVKSQALRGTLMGASGEGTVFTVAFWATADNKSACGTNLAFFAEQRSIPSVAFYTNTGIFPQVNGDFSGQWLIVTALTSLGTTETLVGVNDTSTASLATSGPGSAMPSGTDTELLGGLTGRFMDVGSYVAEVIFYPTELSESNRQTTEQYLASKYNITLPY